MNAMRRHWHQYLWIASILYLGLGVLNILFAWAGLLCFFIPLFISLLGGGKAYCHRYCGRGQLLDLLGQKFGISCRRDMPAFMRSKPFRYGFLVFFLLMFGNMIFTTWLVFSDVKNLKETVTLLWTVKLPWQWAHSIRSIPSWIAQFAFGFYGVMLTSSLLGIVTMILFKPRSWCVYCPMGTMTQLICKYKSEKMPANPVK